MKHKDTETNRTLRGNLKSHQKLEKMGVIPDKGDRLSSDPGDHYTFRGHISTFKNARCNDCNRVSSGEIESDYGNMSRQAFYKDPHKFGYLCGECFSAYADQMTTFDIEDELAEKEGNPRIERKSSKRIEQMSKAEMRNLLVEMKVDASVSINEARKNWNLDELAQREIEGRT